MIFLKPYISEKIWGGQNLREYNITVDSHKKIGEAWLVSAVKGKESIVLNGKYKGKKISWLWDNASELFGSPKLKFFPILIKFLDAQENLSVQLHPTDKYAQENEHQEYGKYEAWFILNANPHNTIVYGHNAKNNQQAKEMIEKKEWKKFLRNLPVKKGDCFNVSPGTVHAINAGTFVYEVQQSSDITYRLYDYDRLENNKLRQLHIKESLDNIYSPQLLEKIQPASVLKIDSENYYQKIICNKYFSTDKLIAKKSFTTNIFKDMPFLAMTCYTGSGEINGFNFKKGSTWLIPNHQTSKINFTGRFELFVTYPEIT